VNIPRAKLEQIKSNPDQTMNKREQATNKREKTLKNPRTTVIKHETLDQTRNTRKQTTNKREKNTLTNVNKLRTSMMKP
jgi:hypothetical protein